MATPQQPHAPQPSTAKILDRGVAFVDGVRHEYVVLWLDDAAKTFYRKCRA